MQVSLRIGWFKGGHRDSLEDQLKELAEVEGKICCCFLLQCGPLLVTVWSEDPPSRVRVFYAVRLFDG